MQLVAYGAQDVYLTGNPQITFWKVTYRRHTNFAMESIEQTFDGQADFGRRVTCTISRNGDLAYRTYLQVTLPEIGPDDTTDATLYARWLDYPGHQLISQVEIEIGGQRIDRHYGDWMHIWNQLTLTSEHQSGYFDMVGHTTQLTYLIDPSGADIDSPCETARTPQVCVHRNALPETTLYIPLQFWYCRNPGLALPLIALQYHEVKINLGLRPLDECLWALNEKPQGQALLGAGSDGKKPAGVYNKSLVAASLYVDYIFLDTAERRRMAQNPHEYLIEQLQFTGDESIGSSSNMITLNFNHPVKELIWVVQPDTNVDYCDSFTGTDTFLNLLLGAQPFNYTDSADSIFRSIRIHGDNEVNAQSLVNTVRGQHCWGKNPVVTAKLQLNGQDRFSDREGKYFDRVQPYQHHTRTPDTGINVYSFALRPEEHQPSGTCNFSRIDNATLQLVVSDEIIANYGRGGGTAKVRVYATNYNVLRIMSGMGGLAYSN
jgi:hypothetical protein